MRPVYHRFRERLDQLTEGASSPSFLLAVSGGLDSMVMWDLFRQGNLNYGIAHCNFQLRGEASDQDEFFVLDQASSLMVPFFTKRFPTEAFAKKEKVSIQEAARNLRYEWLEKIRQDNGYSYIVTAHHLDDSLETFVYNFTKGSGLKGLLGMPEKNKTIIRPLLSISREVLELYYQSRRLRHREDASNADDYYQRNKIRHQVLPVLYEINPGLAERFQRNTEILQETYHLFQEQVRYWKERVWEQKGEQIQLHLSPLRDHPALATLLYEWLQNCQFHPDQTQQMAKSFRRQQTGARFFSSSHELLIDRATLIVKKRKPEVKEHYHISREIQQIRLANDGIFTLRLHKGQPQNFPGNQWEAVLDAGKLQFPLHLRHWKAGDKFSPLGMDGKHKKIQDLFTDRKLSRFEKEQVWLLTDINDEICWVIGLQIDDRYKISSQTKAYFHLTLSKHPK